MSATKNRKISEKSDHWLNTEGKNILENYYDEDSVKHSSPNSNV